MAVPKKAMMGRGPSSLHQAGFLSTTVSGGPAGQVLSGASQPEQAFKAAYPSYSGEPPNSAALTVACAICALPMKGNWWQPVERGGKPCGLLKNI